MCTLSNTPSWLRRLFGLPNDAERQYATPERLADVMALIQVLALDKNLYRSEDGLRDELKGGPRSTDSWKSLAEEHPEFFRVDPEAQFQMVLIARHVLPKNDQGVRRFSPEFVSSLLQTAVWVAIIAAVAAITIEAVKKTNGA